MGCAEGRSPFGGSLRLHLKYNFFPLSVQGMVERVSQYSVRANKENCMAYVNADGINLYYEEYGTGPAVILTAGGRGDHNQLRPMAAFLSAHCRVIIHDRVNCGRSDIAIGGNLSEQHLWAEEMAGLLEQIGAYPVYAAGGSAGSRTSLTLAYRHPELVNGVYVWEVSGGPHSGELMAPGYYGQYIEAAERGGMAAVAETEFFAQRINDNPSNRQRLWRQTRSETSLKCNSRTSNAL